MDIISTTDVVTYLNTVGLGLIAWRLLTATEKKMDKLSEAINRLVRVDALALIHDPHSSAAVRDEAQQLVKEIDTQSG